MTHASKRKGNGFEREIVNLLQAAGIQANRVPLSGAVSGYEGDLRITVGGLERRAECKRRRRAFGTLTAMLGNNDFLFVRDDHCEPLVALSIETFCALVRELDFYKDNYIARKYHETDQE
jgi:Holliday junction resolvase